ncbi:hypothetical protein NE237_020183 [Protea cynaroides]|uniref:E3 ubiquitin ligase UBR4 C-terminal domain-containing protein n=1 Tax=Protea cynaroides TaxID=273540 RepID=A0A9Q0K3M5_9MAGN|nr:hypothetical protein NE237_020183 [Protea cynaroides]
MKLDTEPMNGHSTLVLRPVSKFLVDPLEMEELKAENEILIEDKHRMTYDVKCQKCEKDVESLANEKYNEDGVEISGLLNSIERDNLINGRGNKMDDCVVPCTIPANEILTEGKHRMTYDIKSQKCEKDVEPLANEKHNDDGGGKIPGLLNSSERDVLINGRENKMEGCLAPCTIPLNEFLTEDKHRMTYDVKSQKCEKDVEQLANEKHEEDGVGKKPGLLNSSERDDLVNGRGNKMAPCTIPSNKVELSEKGGECYTDKSVTECEMPEQIAFFKGGAYHVVKDICIDEGVPSLDKVLVEHSEEDHKHSFQPSYLDFPDVCKKSVVFPSLISDEMKSLVGHYHNMDVSTQCGSENVLQKSDENIDAKDDTMHNEMNSLVEHACDDDVSMQCCSKNQLQKGEAIIDAKDEILHDILGERVVTENMPLFPNLEKENCHPESYQFKSDQGQQNCEEEQLCSLEKLLQKSRENIDANDEITKSVSDDVVTLSVLLLQEVDIQNFHPTSSKFDGDEDQEQSNQDRTKEPVAAHSVVCSVAEEPSDSSGVDKAPIDGKVESGSITFDFDSPTTSTREDRPHNADDQQCLQTLPGGLEDGKVDSLTTSSRSFFNEPGHGESSLSAVSPPSGQISNSGRISSGPVPYSGSISLRSDSSTTSTRSFAFPILQPEWGSSPVKMAKADRRHYRKHRGEADESDIILTVTNDETGTGERAKKIVLMFLERLGAYGTLQALKSPTSNRETQVVARILPYLTYGEPAAMEELIQHFNHCLQDWGEFDQLQIGQSKG